MRTWILALLAPWVGCHTPTPPEPDPGDPRVGEVSRLLQAAVGAVFEIDATAIEGAYGSVMEHADSGCPYQYAELYWIDNCDTSAGAEFDGYVTTYADEDGSDGYGRYWTLYGEATLRRPAGAALAVSGYTGWGAVASYGVDYEYHYAYGTFSDEADGGTWLSNQWSVGLYTQVGVDSVTGARSVYIDGSIGGLEGDPGQSVDLSAIALVDDESLGQCVRGPTGSIWIRTSDASWFEVELGDDRCDGCGTLRLGEEALGTVCADFSGWLQWEGSPW